MNVGIVVGFVLIVIPLLTVAALAMSLAPIWAGAALRSVLPVDPLVAEACFVGAYINVVLVGRILRWYGPIFAKSINDTIRKRREAR